MDFLDISSFGVAYRYVVKIEKKFRHQNKREFGSPNQKQPKYEKDDPDKQLPKNQSKPQEKKGHRKTKKDTRKWCISTKDPSTTLMNVTQNIHWWPRSNIRSETLIHNLILKILGKRRIIDADPTAIIATATIQPEEPTDPEEGEHLFHSQMWVKGTPLHFIVDRGSQKNLISTEVIK
jgi:hypothetical protein